MTEPKPNLSPAEAMAIDAISSPPPAGSPEQASEGAHEPALQEDAQAHAPEHTAPHDAGHGHDHAHDHPDGHGHVGALADAHGEHVGGESEHDSDVQNMRSALLEAAELANRAAGLAAKTGSQMHEAATTLIAANSNQRFYGIVVLATFSILMVMGLGLFGFMSMRLLERIAQADAMLLAVGKRVVTMDESMALITDAGESLRDMSSKQDTITSQQNKIDGRLDDVTKAIQTTMDAIAKPVDNKGPDVAKLLSAMDARVQSQSAALAALSSQIRSTPAPRPDPTAVRREIETALRQQKAAEAAAKPVAVAPTLPPPPPPKPKENLVQYPRVQAQGKTAETP